MTGSPGEPKPIALRICQKTVRKSSGKSKFGSEKSQLKKTAVKTESLN